jgi:hypothetical protein
LFIKDVVSGFYETAAGKPPPHNLPPHNLPPHNLPFHNLPFHKPPHKLA